jgi:hypothetical protein
MGEKHQGCKNQLTSWICRVAKINKNNNEKSSTTTEARDLFTHSYNFGKTLEEDA